MGIQIPKRQRRAVDEVDVMTKIPVSSFQKDLIRMVYHVGDYDGMKAGEYSIGLRHDVIDWGHDHDINIGICSDSKEVEIRNNRLVGEPMDLATSSSYLLFDSVDDAILFKLSFA